MSLKPHGIGMSISPDGKTALFPYDRIHNLYHAQVRDADIGEDGVIFHLWAGTTTEDVPDISALAPVASDPDTTKLFGADYLAFFKRNGDYIKAIRLGFPFKVVKAALLAGGSVLLLGVDRTQATPVLAVIDDSGRIQRYLDADTLFPRQDTILKDGLGKPQSPLSPEMPRAAQLASAITRFEFSHFGSSVLLLAPGSPATVIEIPSRGWLRSVHLLVPEGLRADSIVSSSGGTSWVVRCLGRSENESSLMEFNPQTGDLIRQINTGDLPSSVVNCVDHGVYYGLRWSPDSKRISTVEGRP